MGQIKARVRSEVFHALDDQSDPRPPLSNENMLINELIREYLEFNKYKYTSSVLTAGACVMIHQDLLLEWFWRPSQKLWSLVERFHVFG